VERDGVLRWVEGYERAWRAQDGDAIPTLFTADARYRRSPYESSIVGHAAITAFWLDDDEDGEVWTMDASVVAMEGAGAVVRAEVRYGDPLRQEYRDLWVLHFADDGRVDDFEEWPYWPDRPFIAPGD
jgi:SnoaL-like domain